MGRCADDAGRSSAGLLERRWALDTGRVHTERRPDPTGILVGTGLLDRAGVLAALLGAGLLAAVVQFVASIGAKLWIFAGERADGPVPSHPTAAEAFAPVRRTLLATFAFQLPLTLLTTAALSGLVAVTVTRDALGTRTSLREAWRLSRGAVAGLILLALLSGLLTGLGTLLCIVPGFILAVRWATAAPALVTERLRPAAALRRSWFLVQGMSWRVLGIFLLGALIAGAASGVATGITTVIARVLVGAPHPYAAQASEPLAYYVIQAIGPFISAAIVGPCAAAMIVLLYIDLRMRKEGLDQVLRAAAAQA
jgi:hypothetical protein